MDLSLIKMLIWYVCKAGYTAIHKARTGKKSQGATAIFTVNLKRIITFLKEKIVNGE